MVTSSIYVVPWLPVLVALAVLSTPVRPQGCGLDKVDLAFVIDGSGSICANGAPNCQNWRNMLNFLTLIVDNLHVELNRDRVALVQFGNQGKVQFGLTEYTNQAAVKAAIQSVPHAAQNTNTSGGLYVMRTQVLNGSLPDRPNVANVAVVLTDGKATFDKERTIPEAERAHAQGINIFAVGVTSGVDEEEVKSISSSPHLVNQNYWLLKDFGALQTSLAIVQKIYEGICESVNTRTTVATADGCPMSGSHRRDLTCYLFRGIPLKWAEAEAHAVSMGGHLVAIRSNSEQTYLSDLMRQYGESIVWTGGRESDNKHWTYVTDGSILQGQGCFADDQFSRDLSYKTPDIDLLTPQKCISECRKAGYAYAGVQGGLYCYCGNDFGRYGLVQGCTISCPGDSRYKCGGFESNYIYMVDAVWGEWSENQPNNFGGVQDCGALYYSHQYKYADEACGNRYQYFCHIPGRTTCSSVESGGMYMFDRPVNPLNPPKCYFIGERKLPWYEARNDCMARGGDLGTMMTVADYLSVSTMLDTAPYTKDGLYMWAGVHMKSFSWSNGERMTYLNWRDGSPTDQSDECVSMDAQDNYRWRDGSCTRRYAYFIQWNIAPTTTTIATTTTTTATTTTTTPRTTTTTTTTRPTTKSTTTSQPTTTPIRNVDTSQSVNITSTSSATRSTGTTAPLIAQPITPEPPTNPASTLPPQEPQAAPDAGASTNATGSPDILMILIALILVLILIMLVTICLLIYYNYRRRNLQVGVGDVVDTKTKTIKYNIYEPPKYEEIHSVPDADTNNLLPNVKQPALKNYTLSKTYQEDVDADYDITAHVYSIQEEADRRATRSKRRQDQDSGSDSDSSHKKKSHHSKGKKKVRKHKKRAHEEKEEKSQESTSRNSSDKKGKESKDAKESSSHERY